MLTMCKPTTGHGAKPYEVPLLNDFDLGYIAGLFDGEGCFHAGASIQYAAIFNTNKDLLQYVLDVLKVGSIMKSGDNEKRGFKPCWVWKVQTLAGCLGVARMFEPILLVKQEAARKLISAVESRVEVIE